MARDLHRESALGHSIDPAKDRLLSINEAAELLGVTDRFVRRIVGERRITFVKIGKHVRIAESDALAFISAGTVPAVARPATRSRVGA